jgi:hypothetical protein
LRTRDGLLIRPLHESWQLAAAKQRNRIDISPDWLLA